MGAVQEVPNITTLNKKVESHMVGWKPTWVEKSSGSWNLLFHQIVTECNLKNHYSPSNLPECYHPGNSCGHVLHVELEEAASNTLRLTTFELVENKSSALTSQVASSFIDAFVFHNHVWDLGFQFEMAKTNSEKLFHFEKDSCQNYSSTCVCPCSSAFVNWHEKTHILSLPNFEQCDDTVFADPTTFLKHIHSKGTDFYHRIVMRQVQNLYSSLFAKFKCLDSNTNQSLNLTSSTFQSVHKGKITLPLYVHADSVYDTICVKRYVIFIPLESLFNFAMLNNPYVIFIQV